MHEDLQLRFCGLPDFGDFGQGKLSGQIEPLDPLACPETDGFEIGDIGLGAEMDRHFRNHPPGYGEDARVGDDQPVDLRLAQTEQIIGELGKIVIVGKDVEGGVYLDTVGWA